MIRLTVNILSTTKYFIKLKNNSFFQNSLFFQNYDINLERDGLLGDGSFSICRKCVEKSTGQQYAVKIVSRKIDCTQEINLLRACQGHPNIVNLHNVYYDEVYYLFFSKIQNSSESTNTKFYKFNSFELNRRVLVIHWSSSYYKMQATQEPFLNE